MMNRTHSPIYILIALGLMAGCSSVPPTLNERGVERISQIPPESRKKIERSIAKDFQSIEASEIHDYLSRIAKKLFPPVEASGDHLRILLVSSSVGIRSVPQIWMIPPAQGYIDERILKALQFENEIAAAIAFHWERTQDLGFEKRFVAELDQTNPDFRKIYEFSEVEDLKAIEGAVDRIYRSGYDPRGLVSYFERVSSLTQGRTSTSFEERIPLLQDKARRTISSYAPLLNPIVRTEEFYKMRKKLERL